MTWWYGFLSPGLVENLLAEVIAFCIGLLVATIPIIIAYLKRRSNWYSPEYDSSERKPPHWDIVTSSVTIVKPANAPEHSTDQEVIGDANPALLVISRSGFRHFTFRQYTAPRYKSGPAGLDESIMAFGGEYGNEVTHKLLVGLDCPLRFQGYSIVDSDPIRIFRSIENTQQSDRVELDFALLVKAPNPYAPKNTIYIFAGIHKMGTHGAALCTKPEYEDIINLATRNVKHFALLLEVQVIYRGEDSTFYDVVIPRRVVTVYEHRRKDSLITWSRLI